MAWSNRPREEGPGNIIVRRARAWQFAKNGLVPDSKVDAQQYSTNAEKTTYRRTNRVDDGLICEWWFDEGEGDRIYDRTLGTIESDLTWNYNAGLGFLGEWSQDASLDNRYYLNLSAGGSAENSTSPEPISDLKRRHEATVEAWIKPTAANGLATSGPGRVFLLGPIDTGYTDQCLMLGHGSWTSNSAFGADAFSARVKIDDAVVYLAGDGLATTGLHHLALTCKYIGNNQAKAVFYVDGVEVDSKTIPTDGSGIFDEWDNTSRMVMGADRDGEKKAPAGYYLGALYKRALTSAEITKNFSEGVVAYSGGYKKGTRGIIEDAETALMAGESDKFFVSVSGGTHLETLTFTLAASSDDANMVYGEDFTLDPSVVSLDKGVFQSIVGLSCHADTSADHVIHVYLDSMTGGTPVQPLNDAYDSFDVSVTSKSFKPELKFSYNANPDYIPAPTVPVVGAFTVAKTRDYDQEISFTVTASADPANTADYYFTSDAVPGVFSAPFQPNPGVNCGTNNQIHDSLYGNVTLSTYTGPTTITVDGTTIENAIIDSQLQIKANDVTVRNCKIFDGGYYNVNNHIPGFYDTTGFLIEDCELYNSESANLNFHSGTARRCWIHDAGKDLVKSQGDDTLIESCYLEKMGAAGGTAHADAHQATGGTNHISRWNYYDVPAGVNLPEGYMHHAAIIWQTEFDDLTNCVVDSNWFRGAGWALNFNCKKSYSSPNQPTHIRDLYIINNLFVGDSAEYDQPTGLDNFDLGTFNMGLSNSLPGSTYEYFAYNNRLTDGSLAYQKDKGPNSSSPYLIDNLTAPPSIPFYESGTVNKVDLSTGITLRIGADELSKPVLIYSEATNSDGIFVDGDSVSGFLVSGDVRSGDDLGDTLQVCSTLSAHEIIFGDSGFARIGLGAGISQPTVVGYFDDRVAYADVDGNLVYENSTSPIYSYEEMSLEDYNQRIELPPVGGETSATTGPRIAVTDHPHKNLCWFVDPGQANASNKIEVPAAGLIVSGYAFKEVRIKTSNTLKFIDCEFSGQTDYHNGITQNYVCWDNNQGGENINKKVDFEYCDFRGGAITFMMAFRKLHKCNFDNTVSDMLRFRNGNHRVTNCYFGKYMNAKDSSLNGNNGHYDQNSGLSPHADPHQIYRTINPIIHFADCTFDQRPSTWGDGTTNPDHYLGANPDKIHQYGGTKNDPTGTDLGEMRFTNCILNGGGNYMISAKDTFGPNANCLPGNWSFKDCKFGTSCRSGIFAMADGHTRTDLGGNVWLETGTPGIRLPQEAIDAGTTTTLGRNNLPISYVIRGLDNVNFGRDGMNESGRTSWGQRGIGWG